MKRSVLYATVTAVLMPAASLWAASPVPSSPNQPINQIAYQSYRIQAEADGLQGYVRSGAHDRLSTAAYAGQNGGYPAQARLRSGSGGRSAGRNQRGARRQAEQLKLQVAALRAVVADTVKELKPNELALHAEAVFADTTNIASRGVMIRDAAMNLPVAK